MDWVCLVVDRDRVRAEAHGVGYRLPAKWSIPVEEAVDLIAAGTPHVTRLSARPQSPEPER